MLVECQECNASISDSAASCPQCGAPKEAFLGPPSTCKQCSAIFRPGYPACAACGAPRVIAAPLSVKSAPEPPATGEATPDVSAPINQEGATERVAGNAALRLLVGILVVTLFVGGLAIVFAIKHPAAPKTATALAPVTSPIPLPDTLNCATTPNPWPDPDARALLASVCGRMQAGQHCSDIKPALEREGVPYGTAIALYELCLKEQYPDVYR